MVEKRATLLLQLKETATAGLNKMGGALRTLRTHWLGVTAAVGGLAAVLTKSFKAWGVQQEAVAKLDQALANLGNTEAGASQRLQQLAADLQKVTTYGDETIISMQAMLASFGLNEEAITKLTPKVLDMAAATGTDLKMAAMAMGRSIKTETVGILTRYGVVVDQAKFKNDALGETVKALDTQFGGVAQTIAEKPLGKVQQLKNAFGDLMEQIGRLTEGPAVDLVNWLKDLSIYLQDNMSALQQFANIVIGLGGIVSSVFTFLGELMGTWAASWFEIIMSIQDVLSGDFAAAYERLKNMSLEVFESLKGDWDSLVEKQKAAIAKMKAEDKKNIADNAKTKAELLVNQKTFDKAVEKQEQQANEKILNIRESFAKKFKDIDEQSKKDKVSALDSAFTTIATMTDSQNRALFAIGKAAAMAHAIINVAQGVTSALSLGPVIGIPLAALIATAGAAEIHKIGAQGMAEGGVVLPREGGTLARIGEAGKAEAVIPLDDDEAQDKIGGLGQTVININAGTIVADQMSITEFAEKIDEALYTLQHNRQTVSI